MRKIFLSAGHSNSKNGRDRGASGNGFIEGEETVKMRTRIAEILKSRFGVDAIMDGNDTILKDSINFFKKLTAPDSIVLDIHFNAGPPTAVGTETLVPRDVIEDELSLAKQLSEGVAEVLGTPLRGNFRGVKGVRSEAESQHKSLGWMRLSGCNVLMEVDFISNKKAMETYVEKFEPLCQKLAEILYAFANRDSVKPNVDNTFKRYYTVKPGDTLWSIAHSFGVRTEYLIKKNNLKATTIKVGQLIQID